MRVSPSPSTSEMQPPTASLGALNWLKTNFFSTWYNAVISVILIMLMAFTVLPMLHWCVRAAHWNAVVVNLRLFTIGLYPSAHLWRPSGLFLLLCFLCGGSSAYGSKTMRNAGTILFSVLMVLTFLSTGRALPPVGLAVLALGFGLGRTLIRPRVIWHTGWLLSLPVTLVVLRGLPVLGLPQVSTTQWGGLMLTLILACVGIVVSFPLGLALALGRQSTLPIIRFFSIVYIEIIRGVPLVSILMMFALLLPLFLPASISRPDMLLRVMVGMIMFTAAYIAENVRGGLQAIPKGQYEAATALGMSWFQAMRYIILPQALRAVIPALVGQFISLFKDTSLAAIIGLLELLGIAKSVIEQPQWKLLTGGVVFEVFGFTALVYFIFTYSMSLASRRLEKALAVGRL